MSKNQGQNGSQYRELRCYGCSYITRADQGDFVKTVEEDRPVFLCQQCLDAERYSGDQELEAEQALIEETLNLEPLPDLDTCPACRTFMESSKGRHDLQGVWRCNPCQDRREQFEDLARAIDKVQRAFNAAYPADGDLAYSIDLSAHYASIIEYNRATGDKNILSGFATGAGYVSATGLASELIARAKVRESK